jgi:hypothetical protein
MQVVQQEIQVGVVGGFAVVTIAQRFGLSERVKPNGLRVVRPDVVSS